jgi:hypothetical protein
MQQSPSSEADSGSASEEILHFLQNPRVHYRVNKNPPLAPVLSHMNQIYTPWHTIMLRSTLILSSHLHTGLQVVWSLKFYQKHTYSDKRKTA